MKDDLEREAVTAPVLVMHVERGNLRAVFPLTAPVLLTTPAREVCAMVAGAMIELCAASPGRSDKPVVAGLSRYGLRLRGRDDVLDPDLPVAQQTEGAWKVETLPLQGQGSSTARLPVAAFELVDVDRPRLRLLSGGRPE